MAKSKKTKTDETVTETTQATDTVPPEAAAEKTKPAPAAKKSTKKPETLEADEKTAVSLKAYQCPRCKTENSAIDIVGTPYRKAKRGFRDGVEYSMITRTMVLCTKCGTEFIQSDYR